MKHAANNNLEAVSAQLFIVKHYVSKQNPDIN